jgi:hypothetical protein
LVLIPADDTARQFGWPSRGIGDLSDRIDPYGPSKQERFYRFALGMGTGHRSPVARGSIRREP